MSHIFISYSRKDSGFVDQLIQDIEKRGIAVWVDRQDIGGGETWRAAIADAIRSCLAFVIVLSPNSTESKNVSRELSLAESHNRQIIPLLYQLCEIPPTMEYQLAEIQMIDLTAIAYDDALDRLIEALGKAPGAKQPREVGGAVVRERTQAKSKRKLLAGVGLGLGALLLVLAGLVLNQDRNQDGATATSSPTPNPVDSDVIELTAKGINEYEEGNHSAAIRYFNGAIERDSNYPDAYFFRAQTNVAINKINSAIADFEKARDLAKDEDMRGEAKDFLKKLQQASLTSTPPPVSVSPQPQPSSTSIPRASVSPQPLPSSTPIPRASVSPQLLPTSGPSPSATSQTVLPGNPADKLVGDMFSGEKKSRIKATTELIIDQKQNPKAVSLAVAGARGKINNKSGVINTLVYLESVDPKILKAHQREINDLLDAINRTGPGQQTAAHVQKVKERLNN
jgi:tetratricopeptide (TPR) repeat protein